MKSESRKKIETLVERYPALSVCRDDIVKAAELMVRCYENGGKIMTCGNGGSAADSEHIVGELMKCFKRPRNIEVPLRDALRSQGIIGEEVANLLEGGIKAIALTSHPALSTAYSNDRAPQMVFAQQLSVLGASRDCLIAISTSGNSQNCIYAAEVARAKGIKVVAMTGQKDSALSELADVCIRVPAAETFKIQEYHLPIYHALCAMVECEKFA